ERRPPSAPVTTESCRPVSLASSPARSALSSWRSGTAIWPVSGRSRGGRASRSAGLRTRTRGRERKSNSSYNKTRAAVWARAAAAKEGVEMSKWEYRIINIRSENYRLDPNAATQLNQLGEEGWELVSITSVNFKTGATDNIAMVFKRPVAAARLPGRADPPHTPPH